MECLDADFAGAPEKVRAVAGAIVAGYGTGIAPVSAIEDLISPPTAAVALPGHPPSQCRPGRPLRATAVAGEGRGAASGPEQAVAPSEPPKTPPATQNQAQPRRPKRKAPPADPPPFDKRKIPRRLPPVAASPWSGADFPDCLDGIFGDDDDNGGGTRDPGGTPGPDSKTTWRVALTAVPPPGTHIDPIKIPSLDALVDCTWKAPQAPTLFRVLRPALPPPPRGLEAAQGRGAVPKYDREKADTAVDAYNAALANVLAGKDGPLDICDLSGPELLGGEDGRPELVAFAAALAEQRRRAAPTPKATPTEPARRKRKDSWTRALPPVQEAAAETTPERPRMWHDRHLAVVSFVADPRGLSPRPRPGQYWTFGRLKANEEGHIGGILESDLPDNTAIHAMLMAGSATVDDVKGNPGVAAAAGLAAFCAPTAAFPWHGLEPQSPETATLPREAHTRSRLVMILVGHPGPERGAAIMIAGCTTRFSSQIVDPANGQVIADQPPIRFHTPKDGDAGSRAGAGRAAEAPGGRGSGPGTAHLVEVAPYRHPGGRCWGIVKRVATLGTGVVVGTIVTSRPPPTQAQLDAYRRVLTFDAHRTASAVCSTPKPPLPAVEHYVNRCLNIAIKPVDIRAATAENAKAGAGAAAPAAPEVPPAMVARMAAMFNWKNTPATDRRHTPTPIEAENNFFRFVAGQALLCCGGDAAWIPNGLTAVAEPIKPSTRDSGRLAQVVDNISFPFKTEARTTHVNLVKSKARGQGLSHITDLDELKRAGPNNDFRTLTPTAAIALALELRRRGTRGLGQHVREQLDKVAAIERRGIDTRTAGERDIRGSCRWAAAKALRLWVLELYMKQGNLESAVRSFGEEQGISDLRWMQLSKQIVHALASEPEALEARAAGKPYSIDYTTPFNFDPRIQRLTFRFVGVASAEALRKRWAALDDGRTYAPGTPAVPRGDTAVVRYDAQSGRPTPPKEATLAAQALVDALLALTPGLTAPSQADPRAVLAQAAPWARGAAIEVVELARLAGMLGPVAPPATDDPVDREEAVACGRKRLWAESICAQTLGGAHWRNLCAAWNL